MVVDFHNDVCDAASSGPIWDWWGRQAHMDGHRAPGQDAGKKASNQAKRDEFPGVFWDQRRLIDEQESLEGGLRHSCCFC